MLAPATRHDGTVLSEEMSSGRTSPVTRIFCFSLLTTMSCSPDTMKLPLASIESICIDSRASSVPLRSICPPPANWLSKPTLASWISPSRCSRFALADSPLRNWVCAWVLIEATSLMSTVSTSPGICARRSENSERGADTASAAAAATGTSASNARENSCQGLSIIFLLLETGQRPARNDADEAVAAGPVAQPDAFARMRVAGGDQHAAHLDAAAVRAQRHGAIALDVRRRFDGWNRTAPRRPRAAGARASADSSSGKGSQPNASTSRDSSRVSAVLTGAPLSIARALTSTSRNPATAYQRTRPSAKRTGVRAPMRPDLRDARNPAWHRPRSPAAAPASAPRRHGARATAARASAMPAKAGHARLGRNPGDRRDRHRSSMAPVIRRDTTSW